MVSAPPPHRGLGDIRDTDRFHAGFELAEKLTAKRDWAGFYGLAIIEGLIFPSNLLGKTGQAGSRRPGPCNGCRALFHVARSIFFRKQTRHNASINSTGFRRPFGVRASAAAG